jgi:hypothetical protein
VPSLLVVCSKFGVFPLLVISLSLSLALGWFASSCLCFNLKLFVCLVLAIIVCHFSCFGFFRGFF